MAISRAQEIAAQSVARAKEEATAEAGRIRKKGESELKVFESSMAKNKGRASDLVAVRLLGEQQ